ncbi:uncharacterized protein LOC131356106 [Hemibagrus wyckioides]|nr:uncharacterized protein LOC131356106 [Hemibagrus wyckioides]
MEAKWIVAVVFICAVCCGTKADVPKPTSLDTNITSCGSSKVCWFSPANCSLTGNSSCFFSSFQLNNQNVSIELSGWTSGYIALGLSSNNQSQAGDVVFVCGNNTNGTFFFDTVTQNSTGWNSTNVTTIYTVQGALNQNQTQSLIQCAFNISAILYNSTSNLSLANTTIYVTYMNGSTSGTTLGSATTISKFTVQLNLTNNNVNSPSGTIVSTVSSLNITRDGCGTSKLCMSSSTNCSLTGNSRCFFASSKMSNQTFIFELSGTTPGYVALGLTKQNSTYVFVCGNDNNTGTFFFQTATQNGTVLNSANVTTVYTVQGAVTQNQSLIQCTFNTSTTFNVSTRAADNSFLVNIFTGLTNGTQLGNLTKMFESSVADLSNATSQMTTQNATNTTSGTNVSTGSLLNITRDGCGTSKLCMSSSTNCSLTGNSSCFFASSKMSNQTFIFELSGTTPGYVALGLTKQNSTYVFVCGNDNNTGTFFFQTATQNGTVLNSANVTTVYGWQGTVTQNQSIQCTFNTSTTFNVSTKAADNAYLISIFTGLTNGTQLIGNLTKTFESNTTLDLSSPTGQQTTPTTATPNSSNSLVSLWTQVLAVLLSAMSLHFITSYSP